MVKVKIGHIGIVVPTIGRAADFIMKAINQYPEEVEVVVIDSNSRSIKPADLASNVQWHHKKLKLGDARNKGHDYMVELGKKYICNLDDDTYFKKPANDLLLLAQLLADHKKLWVTGGMGSYTASWRRKSQDGADGPFYSSWATGGFGHMTRANIPIKYEFDRREDLQRSLDSWVQGGRVALDTRCIVTHLDHDVGGTEEIRHKSWYLQYVDMLRDRYADCEFITIRKDGMATVRYKKLGIESRTIQI